MSETVNVQAPFEFVTFPFAYSISVSMPRHRNSVFSAVSVAVTLSFLSSLEPFLLALAILSIYL